MFADAPGVRPYNAHLSGHLFPQCAIETQNFAFLQRGCMQGGPTPPLQVYASIPIVGTHHGASSHPPRPYPAYAVQVAAVCHSSM